MSCVNLNAWPTSITFLIGLSVNFCIFIAVRVCWCLLLLCKLWNDIMQNRLKNKHTKIVGIPRNRGDGNWCSKADSNDRCQDLRRHLPKRSLEWHVANVKKQHWWWPGNPKGRSKFRKYRAVLRNLWLRDREWSSMVDGSCQRLAPASSRDQLKWHIANVIKHHWQQPGNAKALGSNEISQLLYSSSKFTPTRSHRLSKFIFLLLEFSDSPILTIFRNVLPTSTCNDFRSHLHKIICFATTLTSTEKPRYTHLGVFSQILFLPKP